MSNRTHWKKAFNKEYLGAWDIEEGEELKLTIRNVTVKEVTDPNGQKGNCNVAYFTDRNVKPMILNVGNCKVVERFSGSKFIEDWKGVNIQVYVQEGIRAFGEITDGLRLRDHQPRMTKPELIPGHKRWGDAVTKYKESQDLSTVKEYFTLSEENEKKIIDEAAALQDTAE